MLLLSDQSWFWDQAKDLLVKLRNNLPMTILTTIAMSLIIAFWKKLLHFAKQKLGLVEPPKEPLRASLPEGDIAHLLTFDKFRHGFTVGLGWRGAVIDAGVVQQELEPGRYRRRALAKMIARMGLKDNARVVLWRDKEFPIVLFPRHLFASDHQPMRLEIGAIFRMSPARLLHSTMEEIEQPPEETAEQLSAKIALTAREWVSAREAETPYRDRAKLNEWRELAAGWLKTALDGSVFELVRVTEFNLSNPALDALYREYGELALEKETAKREIERNKVRGALRQAMLAGKLEEIRDRGQYEDTVRLIEQDKTLRERAFRQELEQVELNSLENKLKVWKRKQDLLLQALGPQEGGAGSAIEMAQRITRNLHKSAVEATDSPFSAHEREQIRLLLQSCQARASKPEEILEAVSKDMDIPPAVFDPLAKIRGSHTLRIGDGWKIFDGNSLWQIRLVRIKTRRHGFLWFRESPSLASFEMRGSPNNRRFEQDVNLKGPFCLTAGANDIPGEYLGGTPSRISVSISGAGAGKAEPAAAERAETR